MNSLIALDLILYTEETLVFKSEEICPREVGYSVVVEYRDKYISRGVLFLKVYLKKSIEVDSPTANKQKIELSTVSNAMNWSCWKK